MAYNPNNYAYITVVAYNPNNYGYITVLKCLESQ